MREGCWWVVVRGDSITYREKQESHRTCEYTEIALVSTSTTREATLLMKKVEVNASSCVSLILSITDCS